MEQEQIAILFHSFPAVVCWARQQALYCGMGAIEYYWKHYLTGRIGYLTIVYIIVRHCLGGFYEGPYVESRAKRGFYGP